MASFQFELVAPERVIYSGEAESVDLPASDGGMTVLSGHAPMMTTLQVGILAFRETQGGNRRVFVQGGFADVSPKGLTVLAERALPAEEVTREMIEKEIQRAEAARADTPEGDVRLALDGTISQLRDAQVQLGL